jgi:hypothetical protein
MKKLLGTLVVVAALAIPAVSSADNNASPCGAVHGTFANVDGNFGSLGADGGTPGYHNGARGPGSGSHRLQQQLHRLPGIATGLLPAPAMEGGDTRAAFLRARVFRGWWETF